MRPRFDSIVEDLLECVKFRMEFKGCYIEFTLSKESINLREKPLSNLISNSTVVVGNIESGIEDHYNMAIIGGDRINEITIKIEYGQEFNEVNIGVTLVEEVVIENNRRNIIPYPDVSLTYLHYPDSGRFIRQTDNIEYLERHNCYESFISRKSTKSARF